jgi:hypothetical protein
MWRIITIDYAEPALWVAVVVGGAFAVILGGAIGARVAKVEPSWRGGLASFLAAAVLVPLVYLVTMSVLSVTFGAMVGGASACTDFVRPALYAPVLLSVAAQVLMWSRERSILGGARGRRTRG